MGNVSVVLVDAENLSVSAGNVKASNIVASKRNRKRNRGGSRQPPPSKHPKLRNDGGELLDVLPFEDMVQFLELSGWVCTRSFVKSERYLMEVQKAVRYRRGILKLAPCLKGMASGYDAPRELVNALANQLFPGGGSSLTFYLTKPNRNCGYWLLDTTGAMEEIMSSEPPLFVNGTGVYGHTLQETQHF